MVNGIQDIIKTIGENGCYFISLLEATKKSSLDIIMFYNKLVSNGFMDKDCTILDSQKVVEYLVGKPVKYEYLTKAPNYEDYDIVVEEWYNKRTGFTHFRLKDWDSLSNSVTVKEGYIRSYRCFKL